MAGASDTPVSSANHDCACGATGSRWACDRHGPGGCTRAFAFSSAGPGRQRRLRGLPHCPRRFAGATMEFARGSGLWHWASISTDGCSPARAIVDTSVAINDVDDDTDLLKANGTQITAFAPAPGGGLYASSSNLGKNICVRPRTGSGGHLRKRCLRRARVLALGTRQRASLRQCELFARSGNVDNPDCNWSPWTPVDPATGSELKVPAARFVQWKAVLHAGAPSPASTRFCFTSCPRMLRRKWTTSRCNRGYRYQSMLTSPERNRRCRDSPASNRLRPPCATAIRLASAGRRTTTTTIR